MSSPISGVPATSASRRGRARIEARARREIMAQTGNPPWVAIEPQMRQVFDATRRWLRTCRLDARLTQDQAAELIAQLLPDGQNGSRIDGQGLSRVERLPDIVRSWSVNMLAAACQVYERPVVEWATVVQDALVRWRLDHAIQEDTADAQYLARAELMHTTQTRIKVAQARMNHAVGRLTLDEQVAIAREAETLARITETMAATHGGYAGQQTPATAADEMRAVMDEVDAEQGLPPMSSPSSPTVSPSPQLSTPFLPPHTPDSTERKP